MVGVGVKIYVSAIPCSSIAHSPLSQCAVKTAVALSLSEAQAPHNVYSWQTPAPKQTCHGVQERASAGDASGDAMTPY
jgi:hypothetical protein